MAYNKGKYPFEAASKIAHMEVIRDPALGEILQSLKSDAPASRPPGLLRTGTIDLSKPSGINTIVTLDGGLTIVPNPTRREKRVAVIQVCTMLLSLRDLEKIANDPFMDPRDLKKYIERVDRDPLAVPLSGVRRPGRTLKETNREILNAILSPAWTGLYDVLEFLLWHGWSGSTAPSRSMSCLGCDQKFELPKSRTFLCPKCGFDHFLSDYLDLTTEAEDYGREQLATQTMATIELLALFRLPMKLVQRGEVHRLAEFLLIKDGPLMLRAQGYRIVDGIRAFIEWLHSSGNKINLVGVEKTGDFAEFLQDFDSVLPDTGDFFLPSRKFVIEEVQGLSFDPNNYRNRVSFGTRLGARLSPSHIVALQVPTSELNEGGPDTPAPDDLLSLEEILVTLSSLTSSAHDNALLPLVVANRAASLSNKPSSGILDHYLSSTISGSS